MFSYVPTVGCGDLQPTAYSLLNGELLVHMCNFTIHLKLVREYEQTKNPTRPERYNRTIYKAIYLSVQRYLEDPGIDFYSPETAVFSTFL